MATQEVIKHTRNIMNISKDGQKDWIKKVWEILFEILIIVFAVMLSLWLHNRSVESHAQHSVDQFLAGVKQDLKNDIREMEEDTAAIYLRVEGINYMIKAYHGQELNYDSLRRYGGMVFFGSTLLIPNTGRYEGFKSSGQIANIHDAELANQIVDNYQEDIPALMWVSQNQNKFIQEQFQPYISRHYIQPKSTDTIENWGNINSMLRDPEFYNLLLQYSGNSMGITERYKKLIVKSKKIIEQIEKTE